MEVLMPQAAKKRGPGGRPTKYKPAFCDRAFDFALVGMTDGNIASALKIEEAMLYHWKNSYLELCDAIKRGRDRYDNEVVETALRQRGSGILRIGYQVKVRRNGSRDEPFITLRFSR